MSLFTDLSVDVFLVPSVGDGPGYNKVTLTEDFALTGTVDGYSTGDGGQAVLEMSSGDTLTADSGFGAGTYYKEIDVNSQFWILIYWNPNGNTDAWQIGWQTANGANAGLRIRCHGDGSQGNSVYIHDGTANVSIPLPSADTNRADWDINSGNVILVQVDVPNEFIETWQNSRSARTTNSNRRSLSALTWTATPTANTVAANCSLNGDVMLASGTGILTEEQIERLMQYGKGITWADLNSANGAPRLQNTWRGEPNTTSIKINANFESDPILRIYPETDRTNRGSLLASSGTLSRDTQGWISPYTFTGLDPDTRYQVFAEYSTGEQDVRRMQVKTLPETRNLTMCLIGCYEFDPDISIGGTLSMDELHHDVLDKIFAMDADIVLSSGDDYYYDNIWTDNLIQAGLPTSVADFQLVHDEVASGMKQNQFFERINFAPGAFSDHDCYGNDLWGTDITNLTGAQAHLTQRYGRTYPLAPDSLYYSWNVGNGVTFICLDTITESELNVQLTSTAQRTQMYTDLVAAVGRQDLIIMFVEKPFDDGANPVPALAWNNTNFATERTDIFDKIVLAGANERIIFVTGDLHAGGVDIDGVNQGGYDTGGICAPPCILAARMNHGSPGSASGVNGFPDYYDSGTGHYMKLVITTQSTGEIDIAVTPYELVTEKTTFTRTLGGYPGTNNGLVRPLVTLSNPPLVAIT